MTRSTAAFVLWCCLVAPTQAATTIYRCGPDGRLYSHEPCIGGTVVEGTDGRTAAQRAASVRVLEEERRKAAMLERERSAEQRWHKAAAAVGINGLAKPAGKAASAAESKSKKWTSAKVKSKVRTPKDVAAGPAKVDQ